MARRFRVAIVVIIVSMACSGCLSLGDSAPPTTQQPTAASSQTTSTQARKAEADPLLARARQALAEDDYDRALQSFQQALKLYRKMRDLSGEAQALQGIGRAYLDQGRYAQAIQFSEHSLKLARDLHDNALTGQALSILGAAHKGLKDLAKALEYQQQALTIAQRIGDKDLETDAWRRLGHVSVAQQDYPKALSHYQRSLSAAREGHNKKLMGYALQGIGSAYQSLEDYPKALEYYQQSLAEAQAVHDRKQESAVLFALAKLYKLQKEIPKALETYRQAALISLENQKITCASNPQRALGEAYKSLMEDYPKALVYFQQAVRTEREAKQPDCALQVLGSVVDTHQALKDYPKMRETAGEALALARKLKDQDAEYRLLRYGLGRAHEALGDLPQARVYYQQALAITRTLNKSQAGVDLKTRENEAFLLWQIANMFLLGGESIPEGEKMWREALSIYQETHNLQMQMRCLVQLANAHGLLGNTEEQLKFSQQALAIARKIKDRSVEALALLNLGTAYRYLNNYRRAIEAYQEGLAIAREIKNQEQESMLLGKLSMQHGMIGEYSRALDFGQQAWNAAKNTKAFWDDVFASTILASTYGSLNDYTKANEYAQQAVRLAPQTHSPLVEGSSLALSALVRLQQDQPRQAIALLEQAVTLLEKAKSPKMQWMTLISLATTYTDLKDYPKALASTQEALTIARERKFKHVESESLQVLGDIYRKSGKLHEALRQYDAALATDPSPELPGAGSGARIGLGRVYRELKQPELAITNFKQGVSGIDDLRLKLQGLPPELQQIFVVAGKKGETHSDAYRELADLLLAQGRAAEAQEVLERLKVQELKDFTGTSAAPEAVTRTPEEAAIIKAHGTLIAFGNTVEACQEPRCTERELDQLLDQRDALTQVFQGKVTELEQQVNPRLAKDKATLDPKDFGRKAKELVDARPGTVLIYPLVLEDKLWILWGTTGGVLNSIEVPVTQARLEQAVMELRSLLENPASDVARIKALGRQLYAWLLQPMEAELRANRIQHVVFALDRAIRYIPMSVLFDGEHYLVEDYTLSTIISAALTDTRDRLPAEIAQTPVLALGLSAAKAGFKPLPYVSAELDAIVQQPGIYPGLKFIDDAFNFKALRNHLHGRKILHIATHAAFVPGVKESSFLLLGTGEKLKMTEVEELSDLGNVHLVALSACQTALGEKGQDGVEINAMSYYFLNNGVKAVMASLWTVDDSSTSQLMRKFYSELATAKVTKAQALRQAQLALLKGNASGGREARGVERAKDTAKRYDHPYYWAPFILIGNGG